MFRINLEFRVIGFVHRAFCERRATERKHRGCYAKLFLLTLLGSHNNAQLYLQQLFNANCDNTAANCDNIQRK